jgi:hypothetical protein
MSAESLLNKKGLSNGVTPTAFPHRGHRYLHKYLPLIPCGHRYLHNFYTQKTLDYSRHKLPLLLERSALSGVELGYYDNKINQLYFTSSKAGTLTPSPARHRYLHNLNTQKNSNIGHEYKKH